MEPLRTTEPLVDETFVFMGHGDETPSTCRLRIFLPAAPVGGKCYVVMVSDQGQNTGTDIINASCELADQICVRHGLPVERVLWIEHFDRRTALGHQNREVFSIMRFAVRVQERTAGCLQLDTPKWEPCDKPTVESLVGFTLP